VLSGARGCNKVLCAVQKIFGEKEGPLLLLLLTEYDLNLSQFAWELSDSWRADEIDDIMKAIEAVPSFLLPLDLNQKLSHFNRGYIRKGGKGTIANASMEVFDEWDEVRSPARPYFIYHEFAHNWARLHFMKRDVSNEWLRISGWQSPSKDSEETEHENWKLNSSAHSVSIYAKTNPIEDFAESVSAYRYAPQRLKQVSLAKYKFIKDVVYGGLEFTADSCENVETSPLEKELAAFKPDLSPSFIKRLAEPCLIQNLEMLKVPTLKNGFLSCLNLAAARDFLRKKGQLHKDNNDPVVLNNSFDNARVRFRALERAGVAALPDLILKLERPHLATLKLSIERRSCALAYEPERLREQAKQVNAEQFQASLGVSTLNQKLCDSYVADGEKIINEAVLKKKIADYL
ncbi:MAG TPA: hypothetical protein VN132_06075, partial [Bdellovibrio sp.]|nr:hypothetical protein [Bdellovibrio sp.]